MELHSIDVVATSLIIILVLLLPILSEIEDRYKKEKKNGHQDHRP